MSHYTKNRPTGYYNDLLTGTEADFLKLVKKYSICPPNNVAGYKGKDAGTIAAGPLSGHAWKSPDPERDALTPIRCARMQAKKLVAYIDLKLAPRGSATNEGGDAIIFDSTYDSTLGQVPIYFLPWDSDGASIRMTIPAKGTRAQGDPDPDIFFTAAINGCSIFFQGDRRSPTIYHCGGTTGFAKTQIAETVAFWEGVMDVYKQQGLALGAVAAGSVNKTHYVTDPATHKTEYNAFTNSTIDSFTTDRAKKYKAELKRKYALGKLTISESNPWGCVLGRRNAQGEWTFYMQENTTIVYSEVKRSLPNLFKGKETTARVSRPMMTWEVFPIGPGHLSVNPGIPKIV